MILSGKALLFNKVSRLSFLHDTTATVVAAATNKVAINNCLFFIFLKF